MAKRRMFNLQIIDTDAFLEMPISTQLLYFHLVMRADDEGFVGSPKKIMLLIGAQDDDFKILIAKRFILVFNSGIIVIKHWFIHNTIRMDRFTKTTYEEEKKQLKIKENKAYTENGNHLATNGNQNDNQWLPQVKLSKVKLSKVKLNVAETSSAISVIPDLLKDKQKHIQIIGLWAKAKNIIFTSKEHQASFIRRNLRAAKNLSPYEITKITDVMDFLIKKADFKYTLESVGKYIDEDLTALQTNKSKIVII